MCCSREVITRAKTTNMVETVGLQTMRGTIFSFSPPFSCYMQPFPFILPLFMVIFIIQWSPSISQATGTIQLHHLPWNGGLSQHLNVPSGHVAGHCAAGTLGLTPYAIIMFQLSCTPLPVPGTVSILFSRTFQSSAANYKSILPCNLDKKKQA